MRLLGEDILLAFRKMKMITEKRITAELACEESGVLSCARRFWHK